MTFIPASYYYYYCYYYYYYQITKYVCYLVSWCLTALSAQIGYIVP